MTAGAEVVCNDVVRKVEIEEKCVATVDGNVGGNGNGYVGGGDGKDDADDSSYVFVSGGIEVSAGDPDDTGGVNVDDLVVKSDSPDEVDRLKKEGLTVDPLALETKGVFHESPTVVDSEFNGVKDDVNLENGSTVDPPVVVASNAIGQDVNGHLDKVSGEEDGVVKDTEDVNDANEIPNVETKMDDIGSGVAFDPESTPDMIESCPVTVTESDPASYLSDVTVTQSLSMPDVINATGESLSTPYTVSKTNSDVMVDDKAECQVTVDGSAKPSDDLECQVTAHGLESAGSSTEEREGQVTVDESSKPSEDLASQVISDEQESSGSPIKERECEVSVDGSDSIGSLVDNQECSVSVESEPSGNHTEEVDGKPEEHQELLVVTSEINFEAEPNDVCGGIKAEHQTVSVSVPCQSENKKDEGSGIGLSTVSEENSDSGLVFSEDMDALANGQAEKFDGILEMGETQISGTEADRSPMVSLNAKKENSEEKLEKQVEGSSETLLEVTESVEIEANSEDKKAHVEEDEILESQIMATDIVEDDLNLEDNTTVSANEADVPLETETNNDSIIHVSTASQHEVNNSIDKPQEGFQPEGSSENIETADLVISKCNKSELLVVKGNGLLSTPDELIAVDGSKVEDEIQESQIVATDIVGVDSNLEDNTTESANEAEVPLETETNIESIIPEASQYEVSSSIDKPQEGFQPEGSSENSETVELVISECNSSEFVVVKKNDSLSTPDELMVVEQKAEIIANLGTENIASEDMDCRSEIENVDASDDDEKETEVKDAPVGGRSTLSFSDTIVNSGAVIEFGSIGRHETAKNIQNEEAEDIDGIQSDDIPTSSVEGSVIDAIDVKNEVAEVLAYNFLVRIPRREDENYRDQIRSAQLLVEEKTRLRDAIRVEIQGKRARLKAHNEAYNAAKMEETAARRLVRLKRQEIDSVQSVINRLKNAMSVEDIDGRISNMEHMIQHETLLLKDEKQFIREIKQLKTLRDQLASNMGSPEEIREAIDQKDHNEERMKTLRKELESLKDKASKAEAVVKTVWKTSNEESRKERELQAQFRAADDVRQNVYAQLNNLKRLSYDKNKNFRQFKEDLMAAREFASQGNKDALHRLCANQVETFMEQWNNNDEFRKEYVSRCNMNASRKQRVSDGGPLVHDNVAPVLPVNVIEKADNSPVSIPGDVKSVLVVLPVEEGKVVSSTEKKHTENNSNNRSIENVSGQKNQTLKTKGLVKPTGLGNDDMAVVTEPVMDTKEEENALTKEEIELAKKAEELRKEEIAAKLKEQRRLEEKAKAIEALERKKRNAEKAQIRAELRARKEAEQKEKEREKRLRKKEKKKTGGGDGSVNGEEAAVASSESANETATKDTETVNKEKNKKKTAAPPPHFLKQQQQLRPKPIPPPLVNRNRKRWQQWVKLALAVAAVFFLFVLGNTSYFRLKFNGLI